MSDKLTPITRKETFLAKAGGQDVVTPTPITREETFLQAIIDNGSGGGGGSDLPAVTSQDAGKVLTVSDDGEWVAGEGGSGGGTGGGVLVVTLDLDTLTLDKTWNEIVSSSLAVLKVNADNATHFSTLYMTDILGENEFAVYFFRIEGGSRIESEIFKASSADGYPVAQE